MEASMPAKAVSFGPDGSTVGAGVAPHSTGEGRGPAANDGYARRVRRHPLPAPDRLPMAAADFPPWPTVHGYFRCWRITGFWTVLHRALYPLARAAAGRNPGPTVAIMDGQSVKTSEKGAFAASMVTSGRKDGNATFWSMCSAFRSPIASSRRTRRSRLPAP